MSIPTKVTTAIAQEGLEKLMKYSRMYSYLMSSFTKTYVVFNDETATFYFKGNKSMLSIGVGLVTPSAENISISLDISKFLSAAKKVAKNGELILTFNQSPPNMVLSSDASSDKITLSVNYYEDDSDEIVGLTNFYDENEPNFEKGSVVNTTPQFLDFVHITSTYMATINKNNSIAVFNDKLMYADRTVVLGMNANVLEEDLQDDKPILMHKFILNFMEFVAADTPAFMVNENKDAVLWKSAEDENFWAILAIDPCDIAIPETADIEMIVPEDKKYNTVVIKPEKFVEAIDFFNGLFEASVWKPITFFWNFNNGDQKIKLTYHHPSTEVEKYLMCEEFEGNLENFATTASFILISDSIRTLLSRMAPEGVIKLKFNDDDSDVQHGAGVFLTYETEAGEELYRVVLAKLQDA